jgi:hypothetical protein
LSLSAHWQAGDHQNGNNQPGLHEGVLLLCWTYQVILRQR